MIAGFEEEVVGLKAGDDKKFKLKFPKDYHDKAVADKECEFVIKVHEIFKRELPEINDEFVKTLGQFDSVDDFKKKVEENIKSEKGFKESQKVEVAMLDKLVDGSEFGDIPEVLIDAESHTMLHELQHSIESQGMNWEQYLQSIKKDPDSLQKDFREGAERRVKTSLIMKEIADKENLRVEAKEVEKKLQELAEQYKDNAQAQENLKSDGYKKYMENSMNNEKVLDFLRAKNIKE